MQPRRFGSLLPLGNALLALAVGCSLHSAEPEGEAAQDASQIKPDQIAAKLSERTPDALQHVHSLPALQPTPPLAMPIASTGELVQAHYRPPATDPSGSIESKPPTLAEFGRAPDYRWLQGELLFSSVRDVWRLRYAAADDDDAYGGSVTLVDVDARLGLHAGQRVRVEGRLINPRSSEASPFYHVLKVIEK